jgi:TonB family protein
MKSLVALLVMSVAASVSVRATGRRPVPPPKEFTIGRQTFFDFGPPFNYYDIFVVRPTQDGSSVKRITVTPAGGGACSKPTVEDHTVPLDQTPAELLEMNPCAIREKDLRRKPKRCKKCPVFSGAVINLRAKCGDSERLIRSDILDRDWFAEKPDTPDLTRWTMQLLEKLDARTGPSPLERPVFDVGGAQPLSPIDQQTARELDEGRFDYLFPGSPVSVSQLYRDSLKPQINPEAVVESISPIKPISMTPPSYPPIARAARVEGNVEIQFDVDDSGHVVDSFVAKGHPMLTSAAEQVVRTWQFLPGGGRWQVKAIISYKMNCPPSVQR